MPFLPSNVGYGTITGRLMDTNGNPVTGAVKFTPTPRKILNLGANVTILPAPVSFPLSELVVDDVDPVDGTPRQYTVGAIPEGSQLVATNDADNNPLNWTYTVTFSLAGGLTAEPFSIDVPEGAIVDLTAASPVPASNGAVIVRGPGVPDGGFAGQVLMKVSDDDQDTMWGDQTGGGEGGVAGVTTVNGRAGTVVLTKGDVDLANVDNTSDAAKPVSTAVANALAGKASTTALADGLAGKANTTDLNTGLAGKADVGHTHDAADIATGTFDPDRLGTGTADGTTVLYGDNTWKPAPTGGGGAVDSVNGQTGVVVLNAGHIGLGNVDNTSDDSKPISAATQEALDGKQPAGSYAAAAHSHAAAEISDATVTGLALVTAVDVDAARAAIGAGTSNLVLGATATTAKPGDWVPTIGEITGLAAELDDKVEMAQVEAEIDTVVDAAVATRMPIAAGAPVGRFLGFLTTNPDLGTLAEGDWWFIIEAGL